MPVDPRPIYILGIAQRSGTHYLYDLLTRHPQCRPALSRTSWEGSWEDHLVEHSHHLTTFADAVVASNRLAGDGTRERLLHALGEGLDSFVRGMDGTDDPRRAVTKSPLAENATLFPQLFDGAVAVLLVRDPRAVVVSGMRTFGGTAQHWIREWRRGAREFLALQRDHPEACVVVRYEDLVTDPGPALQSLFARLGLDAEYDVGGIAAMPVRGSSQLGGPEGRQNWHPVPRTADFDPVARGRELPATVLDQVNRLAGVEMRAFGYDEAALDAGVMTRAAGRVATLSWWAAYVTHRLAVAAGRRRLR